MQRSPILNNEKSSSRFLLVVCVIILKKLLKERFKVMSKFYYILRLKKFYETASNTDKSDKKYYNKIS